MLFFSSSSVQVISRGTATHPWILLYLLKKLLSSSSLSPPEHQSAPLYGCLLSATQILFALLLSGDAQTDGPFFGLVQKLKCE